LKPDFRHKKRRANAELARLLASGVSQRRAALLLKLNLKTVARKLVYLGEQAAIEHGRWLRTLPRLDSLQFDEMESFERSKCLPLSIPLAVHPKSRKILGFGVASMPAKGPLAEVSRRKYGLRADHRAREATMLFEALAPLVSEQAEITSDENPKYPAWLRRKFPQIRHRRVKGKRGCVVGQGELKRVVFDPLFSLNHTCAMVRANVNRLFRRTWCTTKRPDRLRAHLQIYVQFHNSVLTQPIGQTT
jgi:hypothetical protein